MPIEFTEERLILCEGSSDKAFLCELISQKGLTGFQVNYPAGANEKTGGIGMFQRFLTGIPLESTFTLVKSILVVADNDDSPLDNFNLVTSQIANAGYGVPVTEMEFVNSPNGLPAISVMMLPQNQQVGSLETVCKQSAETKWSGLLPTLEAYFNASPASGWRRIAHQDKMRIQCLIAATCEPNPYSTIATLYRENAQYHIPLNHHCFNDIADFLSNWDSLLP